MHGHPSSDQTPATSGSVIHWARYYDAVAFLMSFGREKRIRRETIELAGITTGQSVLDVGCGTGTLTLAAKAAAGPGGQVNGIDPSPEMVEFAKRKASRSGSDIDFRVGVVEALPFQNATFDVVLSSLMLHHLPEDVKRKGFAEIARVLKPGGLFFAVDLVAGSHGLAGHLLGGLFGHKRHGDFTSPYRERDVVGPESAVQLLEAAGFTDVTAGRMKFKLLGFLSGRRVP